MRRPLQTISYKGRATRKNTNARTRYAAGTREILECWFEGRPIRNEYLIVDGGELAGTGAVSYTVRK
jgi:formate dehydrogenase